MRDDEDGQSGGDNDERSSLSDLAARISGDETDAASRDQDDDPTTQIGDREGSIDLGTRVSDENHRDDEGREASGDGLALSDLAESVQASHGEGSAFEGDDNHGEWNLVEQDGSRDRSGSLDPKTEAVLELAGDATNVLLSGPGGCPAEQSLCSRLMESRSDHPANLLVVTISETPSQRLSILQNYLSGPVAETAVVDIQNYNRMTDYDDYEESIEVRTVSSPQDLRRIGIVASKILTEWEDTPGRTTMCFHSLSDLLTLNDDRERLFRFLHVLRGRIQSADVRAHYHLDPGQHSEETTGTFESLFDTIIQFEEDGSVSLL